MTARQCRARRFRNGVERRRTSKTHATAAFGCGAVVCGRAQGVKMPVYKHLLNINTGFDQVISALAALRRHEPFHRREIDHYIALSKEARAATNSYLTAVLEQVETEEAGRRFGKRRTREQQEESGSQANMG